MIRLAMAMALVSSTALAQTQHTADWYASHPDTLKDALAVCRDGNQIRQIPECKAVEQGLYQFSATVGYQQLRARMAANEAAREKQWRDDPASLRDWLKMCATIPQTSEMQQFAHCAEAKATMESIK